MFFFTFLLTSWKFFTDSLLYFHVHAYEQLAKVARDFNIWRRKDAPLLVPDLPKTVLS